MNRRGDWMQRLAEEFDLSLEPLPSIPLVELSGDRRVLIENHKGIIQYGRDKICIKLKFGHVAICGGDMEIAQMTSSQLVICGRIDSISLFRRPGL